LRSDSLGTRDVSQPAGARLDGALLRPSIDRDETEGRAIAKAPLEVVQGRPVSVATHVDPIVQAGDDAAQRPLDIGNPPRVVVCSDTIFCHDNGQARRRARVADRRFERLRPEFVSHLGEFHSLFWSQWTSTAETLAGVGLDTAEVVAPGPLPVEVQPLPAPPRRQLLTPLPRLRILHRHGHARPPTTP